MPTSRKNGAPNTPSLMAYGTIKADGILSNTMVVDGEHELTDESSTTSGSNLILNGDWATGSSANWTGGASDYTEYFGMGGFAYVAVAVSGPGLEGDYQTFTTTSGSTYEVSIDFHGNGKVKIYDGSGTGGTLLLTLTPSDTTVSNPPVPNNDSATFTATSSSTTLSLEFDSYGGTYAFDNVEVREQQDIKTLKLKSVTEGDTYAAFEENGGASLYYDNSVKLQTTANGLNLSGLPTYADETAASTGGLLSGDVYKTSEGVLRIKA